MLQKMFLYAIGLVLLCTSAHSLTTQSDTVWSKYIGSEVKAVKFSPDGQFIYAIANGRKPLKLDAETGEILREYEQIITCSSMDITKNGREMVVGSEERKIQRFNLETAEIVNEFKIPDSLNTSQYFDRVSISSLSISEDEKYLAAALIGINSIFENVRRVLVWDYQSGKLLKIINDNWCENVLFSPTKQILAISHSKTDGNEISLLDIGTWETSANICCHSSLIKDIAFSPDGSLLATCGWNGEIKIWDLKENKVKIDYKSDNYYSNSISFKNDTQYITGGYGFISGGIEIWSNIGSVPIKKYTIAVNEIDYSNTKDYLAIATGKGNSITLINLSNLTSIPDNFVKEYSISSINSNDFISIGINLLKSEIINIEILDLNSNQMTLLHSGFIEKGWNEFNWKTKNFPTGVYFCKISSNTFSKSYKIILEK